MSLETKRVSIQGRDGRPYTLAYRPDSSDIRVIEHTYKMEVYNLSALARFSEVFAYYERQIQAGLSPLILDLGANMGAVSNYFYDAFPGSRIVAVEPEPSTFLLLEENVRRFQGRAVHAGVASASGFLNVDVPGAGDFWSAKTTPSESGAVPAVTVEEILEDEGAHPPLLVKIDIEGAERDLFSRAAPWLSRFPVVVMELHDWLFPKQGNSTNFIRAAMELKADWIPFGENLVLISHEF